MLLLLLLLGLAAAHEYCVVGAGPGGLQAAALLAESGRDYVVLEREPAAGSTFTELPRNRQLISINKRHTGSSDPLFNLRHDWNSLLAAPEPGLLMRNFSSDLFPHADDFVAYLRAFAAPLNVRYGFAVAAVRRLEDQRFSLSSLQEEEEEEEEVTCDQLVWATGWPEPHVPEMEGIDLAEGYESVDLSDPAAFEGQHVLILGKGNSAFEVAQAVYGHTARIHMLSRHAVRLAWSTHYVGDVRGVNNELLDTYQLKSLDALIEESRKRTLMLRPSGNGDGRVVPWRRDKRTGREKRSVDTEGFDRVIRCTGFERDDAPFQAGDVRPAAASAKFPALGSIYESTNEPGLWFAGVQMHGLDYRRSSGGFVHGFRYLIRAQHRWREQQRHGVAWPSEPLGDDPTQALLDRINVMDGPYQMFGVLADVVDLAGRVRYPEVPVQHAAAFARAAGASRVLLLSFEYGADFSAPGADTVGKGRVLPPNWESADGPGVDQNFLHPVLRVFTVGVSDALGEPEATHHMVESLFTSWRREDKHAAPLREFLEWALSGDRSWGSSSHGVDAESDAEEAWQQFDALAGQQLGGAKHVKEQKKKRRVKPASKAELLNAKRKQQLNRAMRRQEKGRGGGGGGGGR